MLDTTFGVFFMEKIKRNKFSQEDKLDAVHQVLEDHLSCHEVARRLHTKSSMVGLWVRIYQHHGCLSPEGHRRPFSVGEKLMILSYMRQNNLSLSETSVRFNVSLSAVATWKTKHERGVLSLLSQENRGRKKTMTLKKKRLPETSVSKSATKEDPNKSLLEELEYLRAENAYLKKLRALVQERIDRESGNGQPSSRS
jgi:transposase